MKSIGIVSIIMAAYNAEKTIAVAINSVISQTYSQWELIVIDDCSADGTAEKVRQFDDKRITLLQNQENKGVSYSRHYGTTKSHGDWIAILDSDDAWTPDKLEKQVELQIKSKALLIYTGSAFMDTNGTRLSTTFSVPQTVTYKKLLKQNIISNSSALVLKKLYIENEVLDDSLHEDFACWLKILKTGIVAYGINEPLIIYRLSNGSKSRNKLRSAVMNWRTYRVVAINPACSFYYMICYTINGIIKQIRIIIGGLL